MNTAQQTKLQLLQETPEYGLFFATMTERNIKPEILASMTPREMLDEILHYEGIIGYTDFILESLRICGLVAAKLTEPPPPAFTLNSETYGKLIRLGYLPSEINEMTSEELLAAYQGKRI